MEGTLSKTENTGSDLGRKAEFGLGHVDLEDS